MDTKEKVGIYVAVIGIVGVIGGAIITNFDKFTDDNDQEEQVNKNSTTRIINSPVTVDGGSVVVIGNGNDVVNDQDADKD